MTLLESAAGAVEREWRGFRAAMAAPAMLEVTRAQLDLSNRENGELRRKWQRADQARAISEQARRQAEEGQAVWAARAGRAESMLDETRRTLAITAEQRDKSGQKIQAANNEAKKCQERYYEADRKLRERIAHEAKTGELGKLVEQAAEVLRPLLFRAANPTVPMSIPPSIIGPVTCDQFVTRGDSYWESPEGKKSVQTLIDQANARADG